MGQSRATIIELNDELRTAAEQYAREHGITLDVLIAQAIRQSMSRSIKPKRRRIAIPTDGQGGVAPGVDINDNASLRELIDEPDHT